MNNELKPNNPKYYRLLEKGEVMKEHDYLPNIGRELSSISFGQPLMHGDNSVVLRPVQVDATAIELTQDQFAIVDIDDYERLSEFSWRACANGNGEKPYARTSCPREEGVPRRDILMHRYILDAPEGIEVDHINGNTLDNRKSNLRLATRSQQLANTCKRSDGRTSRFKGVCFDKARNKFAAEITVEGKQIHLGRFESEEEAAEAYNKAAEANFGEYARLNLITPPQPAKPKSKTVKLYWPSGINREVTVHADGHVSLPCGDVYTAESIDAFIKAREEITKKDL